MKYPKLLVFLVTMTIGLTSRAELNTSKLECTYKTVTGQLQTLIFEGPEGTDLTRPTALKSIYLRINGSTPVLFSVSEIPTIVGSQVTYSYTNPFYINDIVIIIQSSFTGSILFKGSLTVDHPPVYTLLCEFKEVDAQN